MSAIGPYRRKNPQLSPTTRRQCAIETCRRWFDGTEHERFCGVCKRLVGRDDAGEVRPGFWRKGGY